MSAFTVVIKEAQEKNFVVFEDNTKKKLQSILLLLIVDWFLWHGFLNLDGKEKNYLIVESREEFVVDVNFKSIGQEW